jgi:hypothetical protein
MKTYHGGCHCGKVKFTVTGEFTEGLSCNCSHCKAKGMLLSFVPSSQVTLSSGAETLTTYKFNKMVIDHQFCPVCGVQPFGKAGDTYAINLNCLEGLDTETLKINKYDGASL